MDAKLLCYLKMFNQSLLSSEIDVLKVIFSINIDFFLKETKNEF